MSLTKSLNSKVNIKQYSGADLPVQPKQPVVARYQAESTLNQTIISLPFQVDTVNAADSFILTVDGKTLTPGALYDYQFSAVDTFGFSSTVTLTQSLAAGLNIQGIKLGMKKETEFLQDARFTNLYESQDQALQGFVRTADVMVATAVGGTPGSGVFYSNISNRASIPDLRTDLKARMGVERITTYQIVPLMNEVGASGEQVFSCINDPFNQIRFVGNWINVVDLNGVHPTSGNNTTDYVEVVFYGTGLNVLLGCDAQTRAFTYSVDGGAPVSGTYPTISMYQQRGFGPNVVTSVVSGLSQGVHTVKIFNNSVSQATFLYGFEIINASAMILNPGSSYIGGKKLTTLAQQSLVYNTTFESGTLGTRGGRVVVYQKADGTIAKAVQPVDAASALLSSASHANEEIVRAYNYREFGAGRADDFSTLVTTSSNRAFTLDDGTTTLLGSGVYAPAATNQLNPFANGSYIIFTFVGTGLDLVLQDSNTGGSDTYTYQIDGGTAAAWPNTAGSLSKRTQKIVSGLPYGTHTFRLNRVTASTWEPSISQFIVYQPKKPTVPTGAVELADYNVMANYTANTVAGVGTVANGILKKAGIREFTYTGAFTAALDVANLLTGWGVTSSTNADFIEFGFFGTGFELRNTSGAGLTYTISVDGSTNLSGFTTSVYGANIAITPGTGTVVQSVAAQNGQGVQVSGLSLGSHRIRMTKTAGASGMGFDSIDVITPIHSAKGNPVYDVENTAVVGSCAISDNRKTSALKDVAARSKNTSQAFGVANAPTTTSTTLVPTPDMSVVHTSATGKIKISATIWSSVTSGLTTSYAVVVDGIAVSPEFGAGMSSTGGNVTISITIDVPVSVGTHKVDIFWRSNSAGTSALAGSNRVLTVDDI